MNVSREACASFRLSIVRSSSTVPCDDEDDDRRYEQEYRRVDRKCTNRGPADIIKPRLAWSLALKDNAWKRPPQHSCVAVGVVLTGERREKGGDNGNEDTGSVRHRKCPTASIQYD